MVKNENGSEKTNGPKKPGSFRIWKTVKLGIYKTPEEYRQAFQKAKIKINWWNRIEFEIDWGANNILNRIDMGPKLVELNLVFVCVSELDFNHSVPYSNILIRGIEFGLETCPAEIGPALRLAYTNQPYEEKILIAMEPVTGSDGRRHIFQLHRSEHGLWLATDKLTGELIDGEKTYGGQTCLVFVRHI